MRSSHKNLGDSSKKLQVWSSAICDPQNCKIEAVNLVLLNTTQISKVLIQNFLDYAILSETIRQLKKSLRNSQMGNFTFNF